jgi:hypothetical protein
MIEYTLKESEIARIDYILKEFDFDEVHDIITYLSIKNKDIELNIPKVEKMIEICTHLLSFVAFKARTEDRDYEFSVNSFYAKSTKDSKGKSILSLKYCLKESTDREIRYKNSIIRKEKIESILDLDSKS